MFITIKLLSEHDFLDLVTGGGVVNDNQEKFYAEYRKLLEWDALEFKKKFLSG